MHASHVHNKEQRVFVGQENALHTNRVGTIDLQRRDVTVLVG